MTTMAPAASTMGTDSQQLGEVLATVRILLEQGTQQDRRHDNLDANVRDLSLRFSRLEAQQAVVALEATETKKKIDDLVGLRNRWLGIALAVSSIGGAAIMLWTPLAGWFSAQFKT